ncbi:MAG: hypothetical protein IH987_18310, partial [Planctomycetes bacterium]|nr:hypothetical protein [Planctomycetota bacterium]
MNFRTCVLTSALAGAFLGIAEVAAAPIGEQTAETKVVRIPSAMIESVTGLGLAPIRALDYGTFVWLELSEDDFERLSNTGAAFQIQEEPFTLRLGETSFDPLRQESTLAAEWKQSATDQPDLHLIQFAGPSRREWLNNLEANGLKIVQYVHPNTYIVWGSLEDRSAVAKVEDSVRWTGAFEPGYRVHPRWRGLGNQVQD